MKSPISMGEAPTSRAQAIWSITHVALFLIFMAWTLAATDRLIQKAIENRSTDLAPVVIPFAGAMLLGAANALFTALAVLSGRVPNPYNMSHKTGAQHEQAGKRAFGPIRAQGAAARLLGLPPALVHGTQLLLLFVCLGLFVKLQLTAFS